MRALCNSFAATRPPSNAPAASPPPLLEQRTGYCRPHRHHRHFPVTLNRLEGCQRFPRSLGRSDHPPEKSDGPEASAEPVNRPPRSQVREADAPAAGLRGRRAARRSTGTLSRVHATAQHPPGAFGVYTRRCAAHRSGRTFHASTRQVPRQVLVPMASPAALGAAGDALRGLSLEEARTWLAGDVAAWLVGSFGPAAAQEVGGAVVYKHPAAAACAAASASAARGARQACAHPPANARRPAALPTTHAPRCSKAR